MNISAFTLKFRVRKNIQITETSRRKPEWIHPHFLYLNFLFLFNSQIDGLIFWLWIFSEYVKTEGNLTRVMCTLNMGIWYFEESGVVIWRVCYVFTFAGQSSIQSWWWFGGLGYWRFGWRGSKTQRCGTLKRVVWYFEEGGMVL